MAWRISLEVVIMKEEAKKRGRDGNKGDGGGGRLAAWNQIWPSAQQ